MKIASSVVLIWFKKNKWYWLTGAATLLVIFWPYNVFHGMSIGFLEYNPMTYNELGDFIGGITTPLLSTVAVVLLYKTYRSQKKELRLTQRALKSQQASSSLFSMIEVLERLTSSLKTSVVGRELGTFELIEVKGRYVITHQYLQLKVAFENAPMPYRYNIKTNLFDEYFSRASHERTGRTISCDEYEARLQPMIDDWYGKYPFADQYVRYVESIIDFINSSFGTKEDREFYHNIFSSQFSNDELGLIYYYSMSILKEQLKEKIVTSNFLRYLEYKSLPDGEHIHIYNSRVKKLNESRRTL